MATIAERILAKEEAVTQLKIQQLIADLAKATRARDWASVQRFARSIVHEADKHVVHEAEPSK